MASVCVAVEGCGHGELDQIYESLEYTEKQYGRKVQLLICCGDFQVPLASRRLPPAACLPPLPPPPRSPAPALRTRGCQACRNEQDLECMACPRKYRHMNSFYKYYSGEKVWNVPPPPPPPPPPLPSCPPPLDANCRCDQVAPCLTIFVGGNHEASNHLQGMR